jgi:serine/threonine protein kinase/tetratricopeptide (TPR) repeat protein
MISALRPCPKCGAEIPADAPEGGCPGCLLESGLRLLEEEEQTSNAQRPTPNAEFRSEGRAPTRSERLADLLGELGDYELLEEVGRGGQGVVFRARQKSLNRTVALKVISLGQWASKEHLKRFRREAEAAASLDHPGIVPIYEVGEREGSCYFSMKFAAGGSLLDAAPVLRTEPRRCVALMAKVAHAVQYAHSRGILHRDLKPGNILLDGRGEPLVSDFGLAKWLDASMDLTQTLAIFGTAGYIAPEQANRSWANLTSAADVYSLGAILFELFTGRTPFVGEHALSVIQQAADKPAPKLRSLLPGFDRDLETICAKCLEREPKARYRSAGELGEDLERWLEGRPIIARPVLPPVRIWRWSKRNQKLAGSFAAIAIIGAAAIIWQIQNRELETTVRQEELTARSVGILPFLDLDTVSPNIELGPRVGTALQNVLARSGPARVVDFDSSRALMGFETAEDVKRAGVELKTRTVLTGTIRHVKGALRVSIRLMDAAQGDLLLQRVFEFNSDNIGASEIGRVAGVDIERILRADDLSSVKPVENDPALKNESARELILAGRELQDQRTALDTDRAIQCFQKASAMEPASALAHACLALASVGRMAFLADSNSVLIAEKAANEALRLNPNQSEAHRAMTMVLEQKGEFSAALEELLRTVESDGLQERLASRLGDVSMMLGRPDRGIQWFQIAAHWQNHPADYDHRIGDCLAELSDDVRAEQAYQRAADLRPEVPEGWMGICRLRLLQGNPDAARNIWLENTTRYQKFEYAREIGAQVEFLTCHYEAAQRQYEDLVKTDPDGGGDFYAAMSYKSALGSLYCLRGNLAEGRSLLESCLSKEREALARAPWHPEILYRLAAIEAALNQVEPALQHLHDAAAAGWLDYRSLALDPRFDALRNEQSYSNIFGSMVTRVASLRRSMPADKVALSKNN